MTRLVKIGIILTTIGFVMLSVNNAYAMPPFSSQEIYDFSNTILVGKVISVNSTFSPTHNLYEIKVEKFLKNQQDSDVVFAAGQKPANPRLGNTVFNVNDRGLFFLMNYTVGYDSPSKIFGIYPSSQLIDSEWDKCNIFEKEIPREHWFLGGIGPLPQAHQANNTDTNNFKKGIPVTITYDASNLSNTKQDFTLTTSIAFGEDHKLQTSTNVVLEPCTVYKTLETSFTPRESGYYLFEIADSKSGSTVSAGLTIQDNSVSTIELLDGKLYFVSQPYEPKRDSSDTIDFHGLKFTYPSYPNPPSPGGSVSSTITFKDGLTKRVGFVGPPPIPTLESVPDTKIKPAPVLIQHNDVFAGLLHDYDGAHLLVSVDPSEISPLQQFNSGTPIEQIQCKQGLMLVKKHDDRPACIKASSLDELNFRGVVDCVWNCSIPIPVKHIHKDKTADPAMTIDGKSFYYYTINETLNSAQGEGKKIHFHDVTFTLFPRPKAMNLGGFCGSGSLGISVLFSDGAREKLSINIPETECMDKFTKDDLTKLTNHTNPQAGLTFIDGKMRLLIYAQNQSDMS
jgi:hypothetical protein